MSPQWEKNVTNKKKLFGVQRVKIKHLNLWMETTQWQMIVVILHHAFLMSVTQGKHYFAWVAASICKKYRHKYRFGTIVAAGDAYFLPPSGSFCDCVHLWAVTGLLFVFLCFCFFTLSLWWDEFPTAAWWFNPVIKVQYL